LAIWGLVHVVGGVSLMVADVADGLEALGPDAADSVPAVPGDTTAGLLRFHGLNVALGGLAVLVLTVAWWRSRRRWQLDVALAIAVALDLGLLLFLVVPGLLPLSDGLLGPLLLVVALVGACWARSGACTPQPSGPQASTA
jgi:hypothetical protein